tara:strand:- start:1727 stop:2161 length:435 start_codon:yes stop_codon:yes gene_type:complete
MSGKQFLKWGGENGILNFIINTTGCKPFSGAGINYRREYKTTILKSVDNTYYYDDNMSDINNVEYTLFGHNGNQDENEKRFNEPLLNSQKTKNIFLYRVKMNGNKKIYIWYGKYEIVNKVKKLHQGKDKNERNIIVLSLKKIED